MEGRMEEGVESEKWEMVRRDREGGKGRRKCKR